MTTIQARVLLDYERCIDEYLSRVRAAEAPWQLAERATHEKWVGDLRYQRAVLLEEWRL